MKDVGKQFAANLQLMNTTTETSKFIAESSIVCNGESVVGLGITADQPNPTQLSIMSLWPFCWKNGHTGGKDGRTHCGNDDRCIAN